MALVVKLMKYHRQISPYARFQILGMLSRMVKKVKFLFKVNQLNPLATKGLLYSTNGIFEWLKNLQQLHNIVTFGR
jgi:hypothetical protein